LESNAHKSSCRLEVDFKAEQRARVRFRARFVMLGSQFPSEFMDELEELIEDIEDLAAVRERQDETTIPHEEVLAELQRGGLIPTTLDDQN